VTPEEIERVDVMYGPFSAAYPGNSVGAVVDYVTRMPTRFEAHAKVGYVPCSRSGCTAPTTTLPRLAGQRVAGQPAGDWSWWLNVNRTDSEGQPLTFATRLVSSGHARRRRRAGDRRRAEATTPTSPGTCWAAAPVPHAQDHLKAKLAYDFTPRARGLHAGGGGRTRRPGSRRATCATRPGAVSSGPIAIGGSTFAALNGADLPLTASASRTSCTGCRSRAARRACSTGRRRQPLRLRAATQAAERRGNPLPGVRDRRRRHAGRRQRHRLEHAGAARHLAAPAGPKGAHIVDFGVQQDRYKLAYRTSSIAGNYLADPAGALASDVGGARSCAACGRRTPGRFAPRWKTVLGARVERWRRARASPPSRRDAAVDTAWPARTETHLSPKAAVSWQWRPDTVLKASLGRAVRFPTVAELYGATATANAQFINDPPAAGALLDRRAERRARPGQRPAAVDVLPRGHPRRALHAEPAQPGQSRRQRQPGAERRAHRDPGLETAWSGSDVGCAG
jgi:iron complex outermembrane receptor protein